MTRKMNQRTEFASSGQGGTRIARLDSGGALLVPITTTFSDERLKITLTIDVIDGQPTCRDYAVEAVGNVGLELMTVEVSRGVKLRNLMSHAVAKAALEVADDGKYRPATAVEAVEAVLGPIRRTRQRPSDERLREVAAAYRDRYQRGGMEEFAESLHVSQRQAYRLVKLARARGFFDEGGA